MSSKSEVTYKGAMELGRVIAYLERLRASLGEGKVCVHNGERFVTLCPTPVMQVEIEASQKRGKEKLSIELSWLTAEEECSLDITAQEPDQPPPADADEGAAAASEEAALEPVLAAAGGDDDRKGKKDKKDKKDK